MRESAAAAGETGMLLSSTIPFCPWASEVFFDLVGLGEERTWHSGALDGGTQA
jgi:hypothetical protein